MAKGFLARMGLDSSAFTRGIDDVVDDARAAGKKIGTAFETSQDKAARAMRRTSRFAQKHSQRFGKSWQVAGVAMAAGIATGAKAMGAAAERSDVYAQKLDRINDAKRDLMANLGEDLFGILGPNPDSTIRKVDEMRREVVDLFAAISVGQKNVDEVNAARAAEKEVARAFKAETGFNQFQLQLLAEAGDPEVAATLAKRARNKKINSAVEAGGLSREQAALLREQDTRNRENEERRRTNQGAENFYNESSRIALAEKRLEARRIHPSLQEQTEIEAERMAAKIEEDRVLRDIRKNELLTEKQRIKLAMRNIELIKERTEVRINEIQRANRERKSAARDRASDQIKANRIDVLRAKGQDKLASAMRIKLDFERAKKEALSNTDLSPEDQEELVFSEAGLARAQLEKLKKGDRNEQVISAGLAGGSTLRRQILGPTSSAQSSDSPVVKGINSIIDLVQAVLDQQTKQTESTTTAVAG